MMAQLLCLIGKKVSSIDEISQDTLTTSKHFHSLAHLECQLKSAVLNYRDFIQFHMLDK